MVAQHDCDSRHQSFKKGHELIRVNECHDQQRSRSNDDNITGKWSGPAEGSAFSQFFVHDFATVIVSCGMAYSVAGLWNSIFRGWFEYFISSSEAIHFLLFVKFIAKHSIIFGLRGLKSNRYRFCFKFSI